MSAETTVCVRVIKTHEEVIEVQAVTLAEAERKARLTEGVAGIVVSWYKADGE